MNPTNRVAAYALIAATAILTVLLWLDSNKSFKSLPTATNGTKMEAVVAAGIVPDVVPELNLIPSVSIAVAYKGRAVNAGVSLTKDMAAVLPDVHIKGTKLYTLMMVDPDAPSPEKPVARCWLHWLVVNVSENAAKGRTLVPYAGPTPPMGTHRYVFLLYEQTKALQESHWADATRKDFSPEQWASERHLGPPVAVMWFTTAAPTS